MHQHFFHSNSCGLQRVCECVCVFVCICVQVCACERGKESSSTYFNLPECKDTKKAIEGIKVLVIEPDWNLEH